MREEDQIKVEKGEQLMYGSKPGDPGKFFNSRTGKKIFLSATDVDFCVALSELPADLRIKILGLTEEEMIQEIEAKKEYTLNWLRQLLHKTWYGRENGDRIIFEAWSKEYLPTKKNIRSVKRSVKNGSITFSDIDKWIKFLVGDRAEFYTKE